ncbi:Uncharacterised protein [uncultured archaeon]|nr:Uncharacterised protein [uncultured archaeon]
MAFPFFGLVNIMGLIDVIAGIILLNSGSSISGFLGICLLIKGAISVFSVEA